MTLVEYKGLTADVMWWEEVTDENNIMVDVSEVNIDFDSERFKQLDRLFDWSTERGKEMIQRLYVE